VSLFHCDEANPYVQRKQKQNRNSVSILLKKGWNCPCRITKTNAKWLWRCIWFVQSNHSIGMTIEKDFIVVRRTGLIWRSSMTFLRWRREIGCSHPIKTLFGESFSKRYPFCFRKIGISPYKTGCCFIGQGVQQNRKFSRLVEQSNKSFSVLFLFLSYVRVGLTLTTNTKEITWDVSHHFKKISSWCFSQWICWTRCPIQYKY